MHPACCVGVKTCTSLVQMAARFGVVLVLLQCKFVRPRTSHMNAAQGLLLAFFNTRKLVYLKSIAFEILDLDLSYKQRHSFYHKGLAK